MILLHHYLKAVEMFLPRNQKDDIIKELSENLLSKMEEKEAELGHPLTESEQAAILAEHGDPMAVAGSYGAGQRQVAFGRRLIGPELYPKYIIVLWLNWGISILIHASMAIFVNRPLGVRPFLTAISIQFIGTTLVFMLFDFFQRKSPRRLWYFPPEYLQPIPRWQSALGVVSWSVYSFWWAAAPHFPSLIFGAAASGLRLAPAWHAFYWPILLLLLAGLAQRAVNLVRPDWNWLQPAARLVINAVCLALLYFLLTGAPYVLPSGAAADLEDVARFSQVINGSIWWSLLCGFSFYWLISGGINGWFCLRHFRYLRRRRRERTAANA